MRISDWSSDVCSSDLMTCVVCSEQHGQDAIRSDVRRARRRRNTEKFLFDLAADTGAAGAAAWRFRQMQSDFFMSSTWRFDRAINRSEEHTSELQSLMRISYAVFCLKKKTNNTHITHSTYNTII